MKISYPLMIAFTKAVFQLPVGPAKAIRVKFWSFESFDCDFSIARITRNSFVQCNTNEE